MSPRRDNIWMLVESLIGRHKTQHRYYMVIEWWPQWSPDCVSIRKDNNRQLPGLEFTIMSLLHPC